VHELAVGAASLTADLLLELAAIAAPSIWLELTADLLDLAAAAPSIWLELATGAAGEVIGCQGALGWPNALPCSRLFACFCGGRTAYRKLPRRCSWAPQGRRQR
jgi:hypothetical protein